MGSKLVRFILSQLIVIDLALHQSCCISVTKCDALGKRLRPDGVKRTANGTTSRHGVLWIDRDDVGSFRTTLPPVSLLMLFFLDELMLQRHHIHSCICLACHGFSLRRVHRSLLRLQNIILGKRRGHHQHRTLAEFR